MLMIIISKCIGTQHQNSKRHQAPQTWSNRCFLVILRNVASIVVDQKAAIEAEWVLQVGGYSESQHPANDLSAS